MILPYNWLVNATTYFWPEIKSLTDLRQISSIVNLGSISLLDNIINKSYVHDDSSIRGIALKRITLCYLWKPLIKLL